MLKEFAEKLEDLKLQYGYPQFPQEIIEEARENDIVIVSGSSDDLIEFCGAIESEGDCFDGGIVYFSKNGVDHEKTNIENESSIEALWCENRSDDGEVIPWSYDTTIPHETFPIMEDGNIYCIGIVFSIHDVMD